MSDALSAATVRRMVRLVDPDWTVESVRTIDRGFSRVSRVVVGTADGIWECVLKATPESADAGTATDARVTAALEAHTSIPVATVLGAVDEHESVPAPFYLARAVDGRELDYAAVGWLDDDELRALARDTGAALAELHGLDAVDAFGHVKPASASRLTGGRPDGRLDALAVPGGTGSWPEMVRRYAERELDRHADSRFGDLTPRLRAWIDERIGALDGPFEPALCRNDHGLHNVLLNADGGVAAMLDWAYTLATLPAFDFEFAVYIYGGAYLAGVPGVVDRRETVREAMLDGYRSVAPDRVDAVAERRPLYELLAATRLMNDFHNLPPEAPRRDRRCSRRAAPDGRSGPTRGGRGTLSERSRSRALAGRKRRGPSILSSPRGRRWRRRRPRSPRGARRRYRRAGCRTGRAARTAR